MKKETYTVYVARDGDGLLGVYSELPKFDGHEYRSEQPLNRLDIGNYPFNIDTIECHQVFEAELVLKKEVKVKKTNYDSSDKNRRTINCIKIIMDGQKQ